MNISPNIENNFKILDGKFYISEIFQSIQGEGKNSGTNSLFIRFHFCNLRCKWCDTKYTWTNNGFKEYSKSELLKIINNSLSKNIIFTGGEPCLYRIDELYIENKIYQIETNGLFLPNENIDIILPNKIKVQRHEMTKDIYEKYNWVISPKLEYIKQNIYIEKIKQWNTLPNTIFKFIIQKSQDLDQVEYIKELTYISSEKIYIGIEGTTLKSQIRPRIVEKIIKKKFNYSPRLQVILWGNARKK